MNSSSNTPTDERGFRAGLERNLGRIDQSITGHALLRDRFHLLAGALSSLIVIGAAIVTLLATSSDATKALFFSASSDADHLIGLFGFIVLLCSIFELQFGWREKFARHAEAANALARLKLLVTRELGSDTPLSKARYLELQQAYENVNDLVTKIPERKFLQLKALHRRKVEMSQFLDKHPGSSIVILRIKIWVRDNVRSGPSEQ
jgi:hypothetical protein